MTSCLYWLKGFLSVLLLGHTGVAGAAELPSGLVYLRLVDATIIQDMRYASSNNFTGNKVPGYNAPECVLTKAAAQALSKVQNDLKSDRLSLIVYDCYRPQRAVTSFVAWSKSVTNKTLSKRFHPRIAKSSLIAQGYIAATSTHSRGTAVDLGLVAIGSAAPPAVEPSSAYEDCSTDKAKRGPDASLDFGTGFDCFDTLSNTRSSGLSKEQVSTRMRLVRSMAVHGFTNYKREWWHFTFAAAGAIFDVPITAGPPPTDQRVTPAATPKSDGPPASNVSQKESGKVATPGVQPSEPAPATSVPVEER